jgi:lipoprotein-releasing system ATP-binding protein
MLQALHLLKKHSTLTVVDDVSLQIAQGEIVSITGPSGAGKSSLLHLLSGLDRPDGGTIHLNGTDLFQLSSGKQAQFRARNIGFVFQAHHLLPEFSALENAAMPLWIGGKSRKEGLQQATEIMNVVGLSHRLQHKPTELSGGEQQRVAIARALVARPAVVFADEPTGNLDSANAEAVHELFLQLRDTLGQTFVIVTHNEALAQRADRIIAMRDGKILND